MLERVAALIAAGVFIALSPEASADERVGQRVFWKDSALPKVGPKSVDPSSIPYPATVTKLDGDWLWLERAWVRQGDVPAAVEAQEKAVALQAGTHATPRDRKAYAAALEHYRSGKPCRDEPGVGNP